MKNIINLINIQFTNMYSIRKSILIIFLLGAFIAITNTNMLSYMGSIYIILTCYNTSVSEEKSKMNYLIKSLPIKTWEFILSKFLYVMINTFIAMGITGITSLFLDDVNFDIRYILLSILLVGFITMILIVPITLIIGFEKGKFLLTLLVVISVLTSMSFDSFSNNINSNNILIKFIIPIGIIILTLVALSITSILYEKKEL